MINLWNILLPNAKAHTVPADIVKTIKPLRIIERLIEVEVAPIIKFVSTDSNIVFKDF